MIHLLFEEEKGNCYRFSSTAEDLLLRKTDIKFSCTGGKKSNSGVLRWIKRSKLVQCCF